MIRVYADIKIVEPNEGQRISRYTIEPSGYNNISVPNLPLNSQFVAKNPFIIGASKVGDGSTLSYTLGYFIGNQLSQTDGTFAEPYTITIETEGEQDHFTIAFDTRNNRHPNYIIVDGVQYSDDDSIFVVTGLTPQTSHTITISNWNAPTYPIVITGLYFGIQIDLDYRTLKSLNALHKQKPEMAKPYYGILSNTGNITFLDFNGEIKDYNTLQLLKSDLLVNIYLQNTLTRKQKRLASFQTDEWDYDTSNRLVNVSLKDELVELQDINHSGIALVVDGNKTAEDLYIDLYSVTPNKYGFKAFADLDEKTQSRLTATKIPYYFLKSGSLWGQWVKLCELVQAVIYQDFDGNSVFEVE